MQANVAAAYVPPTFGAERFTCPYCGRYSEVVWHETEWFGDGAAGGGLPGCAVEAHCRLCDEVSIWHGKAELLLWPQQTEAPQPDPDMPAEVLADYLKASRIVAHAPAAASLYLRRAINTMLQYAARESGDTTPATIEAVVARLPAEVRGVMAAVHVGPYETAAPAALPADESAEVSAALFALVHVLYEALIAHRRTMVSIRTLLEPKSIAPPDQESQESGEPTKTAATAPVRPSETAAAPAELPQDAEKAPPQGAGAKPAPAPADASAPSNRGIQPEIDRIMSERAAAERKAAEAAATEGKAEEGAVAASCPAAGPTNSDAA